MSGLYPYSDFQGLPRGRHSFWGVGWGMSFEAWVCLQMRESRYREGRQGEYGDSQFALGRPLGWTQKGMAGGGGKVWLLDSGPLKGRLFQKGACLQRIRKQSSIVIKREVVTESHKVRAGGQ